MLNIRKLPQVRPADSGQGPVLSAAVLRINYWSGQEAGGVTAPADSFDLIIL